ncbi:MAG TPA: hypothetical protein VE912_22460 [Bacteroidales bacterium]|nr:hypothetical protein [Bacteroidales bacterium]
MKNLIIGILFMITSTLSFAETSSATNQSPAIKTVANQEMLAASCTVSYTNSGGVTFTATASTCIEAYEQIQPFIEAR